MAHVGHGALIGRGTYRAWHIQGVAHIGRGTYTAGRCHSRMSLVVFYLLFIIFDIKYKIIDDQVFGSPRVQSLLVIVSFLGLS